MSRKSLDKINIIPKNPNEKKKYYCRICFEKSLNKSDLSMKGLR